MQNQQLTEARVLLGSCKGSRGTDEFSIESGQVSSWGKIHREIDNKVKQLRNVKHTSSRDADLAFFSEANMEFGYFKDAWRNFVAHSRKTYDSPQALSALQHVIKFIEGLSQKGLKEKKATRGKRVT
jgi:hypothetical protein